MNLKTSDKRVDVLKTNAEIENIKKFWQACRPRKNADLDFYLFIVELLPQIIRPHVLVLYDDQVPAAMLVGRLDITTVPVTFGYWKLPVPEMRILTFIHGGWLGDISEVNANLLVKKIIESLTTGEADAALFSHLNISSPLFQCAASLPAFLCTDHNINPQNHWELDLSEFSTGFIKNLSKKERSNHRYRANVLRDGQHTIRRKTFYKLEDIDCLMDDVEKIAEKTYHRGLGVGFFNTAITKSQLKFDASNEWLLASILYVDEQPCAFFIGSLREKIYLGEYTGYDPMYAKYGVGLYLIVEMIDEMCINPPRGRVERVDFHTGDASYKTRIANCCWKESVIYIFAPSVKAISFNTLRFVAGTLNRLANRLLKNKTPLLIKIKRMWRNQVIRK